MKRVFLMIASIIVIICIFVSCNNIPKDFYFEGEYPPIKIITITENDKSYDIEAIEGHVLMYFSDGISYSDAKRLIKRHGGKIIEQMPKFDYYLIEVSAGSENDFIAQMRKEPTVEYVFLNATQSIESIVIIDNFNEYSSSMGTTHGAGVKEVFNKNSSQNNPVQDIDVYIGNNKAIYNRICTNITNAVTQNDKEKITLINISLGPYIKHKTQINGKDSIIRAKYYDANVTETERNTYENDYLETLQLYASCFDKIGKEKTNFLVTKSSGNEGMWFMEKIFDSLNKSNPKAANTLQKHMILVNASDDKDRLYSNRASEKQTLLTTIDITEEKWRGTSFAAPKLLGYIDKITYEYNCLNAQDILEIIRTVTPQNQRQFLSYEKLEREAMKIAKNKGCNQESEYYYEPSVSVIEGIMNVETFDLDHLESEVYTDNYENESLIGNHRTEKDGAERYGVIYLDKPINIISSINDYSEVSVYNISKIQLAGTWSPYQDKKVRLTGTFVFGNTRHYYTNGVIMLVDKIEVLSENDTRGGNKSINFSYNNCIQAKLKTSLGSKSLILTNTCDKNLIVKGEALCKSLSGTMNNKEDWEWVKFETVVVKNWSNAATFTETKDYKITEIFEETTDYYIKQQNKMRK